MIAKHLLRGKFEEILRDSFEISNYKYDMKKKLGNMFFNQNLISQSSLKELEC